MRRVGISRRGRAECQVQSVYLYKGDKSMAGGLVHVAFFGAIAYVGGGRGEGVRAKG